MKILTTNKLTKKYDALNVVDEVSMTVQKGDIYGLIGRNGAGKTTLLRMICGVTKPSSGSISIYDDELEIPQEEALKRIGSLLDYPSYDGELSAFQNMKFMATSIGYKNDEKLKKLLQCVGLDPEDKKPARKFSLGMKQRLAIAISLIASPKILILDEPVNGMDPTGIFEIRELLLDLNTKCGVTIIISSHLLAELSKMATCYGVMANGRLIREIRGEELQGMSRPFINVVVNDIKKAVPIIAQNYPNGSHFDILPNNTIHIYKEDETISNVENMLLTGGIVVSEISRCDGDLEEQLINMLGGVKEHEDIF